MPTWPNASSDSTTPSWSPGSRPAVVDRLAETERPAGRHVHRGVDRRCRATAAIVTSPSPSTRRTPSTSPPSASTRYIRASARALATPPERRQLGRVGLPRVDEAGKQGQPGVHHDHQPDRRRVGERDAVEARVGPVSRLHRHAGGPRGRAAGVRWRGQRACTARGCIGAPLGARSTACASSTGKGS